MKKLDFFLIIGSAITSLVYLILTSLKLFNGLGGLILMLISTIISFMVLLIIVLIDNKSNKKTAKDVIEEVPAKKYCTCTKEKSLT